MIASTLAASTLRLVGLVCALALLSACEATMEEVIAEHRPAVDAVFGQLKAIDATARDTPPLTGDRMNLAGERVLLEGDDSTALFIVLHNLAAPELASSATTGARRAGTVEYCGQIVRGEFHGAPPGARHFLSACGRARHAFVLRQWNYQPPQLVDEDSFEPGVYEGDVLLFRLADGALLGGFRVSARSSSEVTATMDDTGISLDVIDRLEDDLGNKLLADIDAKLKQHVPGVLPADASAPGGAP